MKSRDRYEPSILGLASALAVVAFAAPAAAQTARTEQDRSGLDEIIVTAERREENLQETPLTVQAFSADDLSALAITEPLQLGQVVPGLQYAKQTGQSNPYIRGVGTQGTAVGDESTVATYVDGVYIMGMQASAAAFNNVERIEVLKGPQGTLFGRNATAGLINIITRDPSHTPEARLGLSYDEYSTVGVDFYGTAGISQSVAADLSIHFSEQGEGYGTNVTTGNDVNFTDDFAARIKFLIDLSPVDEFVLSLDHAQSTSDIASARGPLPGAVGIDGALIFGGCLGGGGTVPACTTAAQAGATRAQANFQDVANTRESPSRARQAGFSGRYTHSFDNFDLISLTAFRTTDVNAHLDQDAVPVDLIDATLDRTEEQASQELRLVSTTDGRFDWMLGAFYLDALGRYDPFALNGLGIPQLAPGLNSLTNDAEQTLQSLAVFAQGSYNITDALTLTAGLRWTRDEREISGTQLLDFGAPGPAGDLAIPFADDASFEKLTWRLSADYELTDDAMVYVSYSRGFKGGVYNGAVTSLPLSLVRPEVVDAYEAGFRSDWLSNRLRANGSAFFYDYTDIQLQQIDAGAVVLRNAAAAEVMGAELEVQAVLAENLTLNVGGAWLDTEYVEFNNAPLSTPQPFGGNAVVLGNVSGNDMIRSPELTGNVGLNYERELGAYRFDAAVNYYYNSGFYWEPDNRVKEDAYEVVNAEVGFGSADERWRFSVWARNLTDSEYYVYVNTGSFGDQGAAAPPRVIGVGLDYNF